MSWLKISPSWSSATWPTKPARPPSAAIPAIVFAAGLGGRAELDAGGVNVVAENLAELVVGDLADEAGAAAQRRDPRHRVRRRTWGACGTRRRGRECRG